MSCSLDILLDIPNIRILINSLLKKKMQIIMFGKSPCILNHNDYYEIFIITKYNVIVRATLTTN